MIVKITAFLLLSFLVFPNTALALEFSLGGDGGIEFSSEDALKQIHGTRDTLGSDNPFSSDLVGTTAPALGRELTSVDKANPLYLVNQIVRVLLSFLGIGTLVLMMYAGARWMTAGGNSEQVDHAKKTLRNAVIGLILILMSYSLTFWVTRRIQRSTRSYGLGNSTGVTVGNTIQTIDTLQNQGPGGLLPKN